MSRLDSLLYVCDNFTAMTLWNQLAAIYMDGFGIIHLAAASNFTPSVSTCVCQHFT